jgi:hypothetical protein
MRSLTTFAEVILGVSNVPDSYILRSLSPSFSIFGVGLLGARCVLFEFNYLMSSFCDEFY